MPGALAIASIDTTEISVVRVRRERLVDRFRRVEQAGPHDLAVGAGRRVGGQGALDRGAAFGRQPRGVLLGRFVAARSVGGVVFVDDLRDVGHRLVAHQRVDLAVDRAGIDVPALHRGRLHDFRRRAIGHVDHRDDRLAGPGSYGGQPG